MNDKTGKRTTQQERLIKGLGHCIRRKALTVLEERATRIGEIATFMKLGVSKVRYQVKELERLDLIEVVEEEKKRGVNQRFYRVVARPLISDRDWKAFDSPVREAISRGDFEALFDDASRSLQAGLFDRRPDRHLIRTPLCLDKRGCCNVAAIQNKALYAILHEEAASNQRRSESREQGIQTVAAMAFFQVPPRGG